MSGNKNKKIAFNYFGDKFTWLEHLYENFPVAQQRGPHIRTLLSSPQQGLHGGDSAGLDKEIN